MKWEFDEICVIGLGLIGGSFALNLKTKGYTGKLSAVDINPEAIERGLELGIIDRGSLKYSLVKNADLIVIATPVGVYEEVLDRIIPFLKKGAIVTDIGSVKGKLVYMCEEKLKGKAPFVGGHPIAGTEKSGVENAVENLFLNAKFVITPTENTDREALNRVKRLWENLGSEIVEMDPFHHDRVFAAVSHLPHVVAYSMVSAIGRLSNELQTNLFEYTGGGFKDFTRIAMSDPVMWRDICIANRENVLNAIKAFKETIETVEKFIKEKNEGKLEEFFKQARKKRSSVK